MTHGPSSQLRTPTSPTRSPRSRKTRSNHTLPRLKPCAAAVVTAVLAMDPAMAQIVPDGRTATSVNVQGNVSTVTTATVRGANAFNSFSQFNVNAGQIANLIVPSAATNLINIVRDARSEINGVLNAYKDGRIGGNIYFANPYGFVVGAGGVVNVGSLHVSTPTAQFVDGFFTSPGNPNDAFVSQLLNGTAPRNAAGLIDIRGRVNSLNDITFNAGLIKVGGSIFSGARFVNSTPDFKEVVNANGLTSATNVVEREGRIMIVADSDVTVSGTIAAPGGTGVRGGDITIKAGGDVDLQPGANIVARGNGDASNGGNINIWADRNATFRSGATIDARAGSTGDGGFIELSAGGAVDLAGGIFLASATAGAAGSVLIDPTVITASTSGRITDGANITFQASDSITVNDNVVISSRNVAAGTTDFDTAASEGDSGSITLKAPNITLKPGAKLFAHATNGFAAGDVSLIAEKSDHMAGFRTVEANTRIEIDGATIRGKNVSATATSDAGYDWEGDSLDLAVRSISDPILGTVFNALSGFNIGVAISHAKSEVVLKGNALIDAQGAGGQRGTVTLAADTTSKAEHLKVGLSSFTKNTLFNVGFVWGEVDATATVDVGAASTIKAGTLNATATNDALTNVNVIGVSKDATANAAAVVQRADVNSSATIAAGANIDVNRDVLVRASNFNTFSAGATSMALQTGLVGIAVNYSELNTSATAGVGANLNAAGLSNVTIEAFDNISANKTSAGTAVGSSAIASMLVVPVLGLADKLGNAIFDKFGLAKKTPDPATGASKPKFAGAATFASNTHEASAYIGSGAIVNAGSDVVVGSEVRDAVIRLQATSSIDGTYNDPNNPGAKLALSGAVGIGEFTHSSRAAIGDSADVTARHVGVRSRLDVPYEITYDKTQGVTDILGKLNSNLGILNGLLTGFTNATSDGTTGLGLTGSVTLFDFDNTSIASVGRNAKINVAPGGTNAWNTTLSAATVSWDTPVVVGAHTDIGGVFGAGNMGLFLSGTGGSSGAASIGGAYSQVEMANVTRAYVSEGAQIQETVGGTPVNVTVEATNRTQMTAVSPSAGRGSSYGANIIFSTVKGNDIVEASVDDEARINSNALTIRAQNEEIAWSFAGAFTKAESAGVGAGLAFNTISANTRAVIADNDSNNAGGSTGDYSANAQIGASTLTLDARTDGRVESIAVAGALASNSDPNEPAGKLDKAKAKFDTLKNKLKAGLGGGAPLEPPPTSDPKFTIALSGSAAVNTVDLDTHAGIEGASTANKVKIVLPSSNPAASVTVSAVNDTDVVAGSGSAALALGGNPTSKFSAGIAGTVAMNDIGNTTEAYIKKATVTNAADVGVHALAGGEQLAVGIGAAIASSVDPAKSAGIVGSVSINQTSNTVSARVEDSTIDGQGTGAGRELEIVAYDRLKIGAGGGSLLSSTGGGVGAAVTYSEVSNTTQALLSSSAVTDYDRADVHAFTGTQIGAGAGMASKAAVGLTGAFVISDIGNTTTAKITGSSVTTGNAVQVRAADTTGIAALDTAIDSHDGVGTTPATFDYSGSGIGLAGSAGSSIISVAGVLQSGNGNVGVSMAYNKLHNTFSAAIQNSAVSAGPTGSIEVSAASNASLFALAFGAGDSEGFSATGSITLSEISNNVTADATGSATNTLTARTVTVKAEDKSRIDAISGNLSIAGANGTSIGLGVAVNDIDNTVRASGQGIGIDAGDSAQFTATNDSRIRTIAVTNGAAATGEITNKTEAFLSNVTASDTTADYAVRATDTSTIQALAGGIAYAGSGSAVGLSVAVNRIDNDTNAYITGANTNLGVRNATVAADSNGQVQVLAIGAAIGGDGFGGAGSVAVNYLSSDTGAWVNAGADIVAERNVAVTAQSDDSIKLVAGALGVGDSGFGLGASVTVNAITGSTQAFISGTGTAVTAKGSSSTDLLTVRSGELNSVNLSDPSQSSTIVNYHALDVRSIKQNKTVQGLAVNASSSQYIEDIAVNIGKSNTGPAIAGNVNVNVIGGSNSHTSAYIQDAAINQAAAGATGQSVDVNAANFAFSSGFSGSAAVGGQAVGVGFDGHTITRATRAFIDNTTLDALGNVRVDANAIQGVSSLAVGGAIGLQGFAVAMTGSLGKFQATTEAFIHNSNIGAGSLDVEADSTTKMFLVSGVLAGSSTLGGTAAAAVGISDNTTRAYINADSGQRTTLDVTNGVTVDAQNNTKVQDYAAGVALAGTGAVAASASVNVITNKTEATVSRVDAGTLSDRIGSLAVHAGNDVSIETAGGSLGVGLSGAGLGAAAAVNVVKSSVNSTIDSSTVYANGAVTVGSESRNKIEGFAVAGGGGLWAGIGGAAAVNLIGDSAQGDARDEIDHNGGGSLTVTSGFFDSGALGLTDQLGLTSTQVMRAGDRTTLGAGGNNQVKSTVLGTNPINYQYQTSAQVIDGSTVINAGSLAITAQDKTSTYALGGGVGIGAVGIGGAITYSRVNANVSAVLGTGVDTDTTGGVTVSAKALNADDNAGSSRDNQTIQSLVFAGSAGAAAVGFAVADGKVTNQVTASVGGAISAGSTISVTAEDRTNVSQDAWGAQVGGGALGVTVVLGAKNTDVTAETLAGTTATIAGGNGLALTALSEGAVAGTGRGGSVGLVLSGVGIDANSADTSNVTARTGASNTITATGRAVTVNASAKPQVSAVAQGVNFSLVPGGVSVGASLAEADANPTVEATLGASNTVTAGSVTLDATQALASPGAKTADSQAFAAGGSLGLTVTATRSKADTTAIANAGIGDHSTLTVAGDVDVTARTNTNQSSSVTAFWGGLIAAGDNRSNANSNSTTRARVGDDVKLSADDLNITADGLDKNISEATSGSGGIISGAAAYSSTSTTALTEALLGSGTAARGIEVNMLDMSATHRADVNARVDSINASVFGGSGAYASNDVTSTVNAKVGANARVLARHVDIDAENRTNKFWWGLTSDTGANPDDQSPNMVSGSGGVVDAPAGSSKTHITHDTVASIGNGADVHVVMPASGDATFTMDALNQITGYDKAKMDSGGLVAVAKAVSHVVIDRADATVAFGDNSKVVSDLGDINAGARSVVKLDTRTTVDTYGLAGAPQGEAHSEYTGTNKAAIGSNALLRADDGNINVAGGQNSAGQATSITANSSVNLWNKTVIPIDSTPDAQSNSADTARVDIASGAVIETSGDITISADKGDSNLTAKGIGKDIYREALAAAASAISNAFGGGSVSFETHGGSTSNTGAANIVHEGELRTGIHRLASLTLDYQVVNVNGEWLLVPTGSKGVLPRDPSMSEGDQIYARLAKLQGLRSEFSTDAAAAAAYDKEIATLQAQLVSLSLPATSPHTQAGGITYTTDIGVPIDYLIQQRIVKLRSLMAQYATDAIAVAAYDSEIQFLYLKLAELGLGQLQADGTVKPYPFNQPSPRATAERRITLYQQQLVSTGNQVVTAGNTVASTVTTANGSVTTIGGAVSTIDSQMGTIATNNSTINTNITGLSRFVSLNGSTNTTYLATYGPTGLVAQNATLRTEILTRKASNDTALGSITTKQGSITTLVGEISSRQSQIDTLRATNPPNATTQIATLNGEITTRAGTIDTLTSEIKSLYDQIKTRDTEIESRRSTIATNNSTIDSNQVTLANTFKATSGTADDTKLTAITNARNGNTTPRTTIVNAGTTISTAAGALDTDITTIATQDTAITTYLTNRNTAETQLPTLLTSLPTLSTLSPNGPTADVVKLDDISVRLGNIRMKADNLTGGGVIASPGDAHIQITNNTPNFLTVGKLTIDSDEGGTLRMNGVLVNGNADINRLNKTLTGANFSSVVTRDSQGAAAPQIRILSNFDPLSPAYSNLNARSPNIELAGDITNLRGSVVVNSAAGSIFSNANIRAGSVDIQAKNGDFVQSFVDSFNHIGGDPASIEDFGTALGGGIIANGSVVISARFLNINSLIQSGIDSWNITLPDNPILTGSATFYGINQSSLDTARASYLNAVASNPNTNPLFQFVSSAGQTVTYDAAQDRIEVSRAFADTDKNTANWASRTSGRNGLYALAPDYGNIGASYDPVNQRYVLDGTQVRGGHIQLYGQIMNTSEGSAGRLRVLDGYGQIKVQNPTGLPVVLNMLDAGADPTGTGRGTAGVIDITDIRQVTQTDINPDPNITTLATSTVERRTVFTRDNGAVKMNVTDITRATTPDAANPGKSVTTVTTVPVTNGAVVDAAAIDGRNTKYDPQTGLRYVWTTGTDNSTVIHYEFTSTNVFHSSSLATNVQGNIESQSGPFVLAAYRLDQGTYLNKDTGLTGTRKTSNAVTTSSGTSTWVKIDEWDTCNWWTLCIASNNHQLWDEYKPTKTITTKSLKGDYPIAIQFSGRDTGLVTVNSASNVIVNGDIRNKSGTTTITAGIVGSDPNGITPNNGVSTADRSITQGNPNTIISSNALTLNATGGVGTASAPIRTAASGVVNASAANGNVAIDQTLGALNIGNMTAAGNALNNLGNVYITSDGSINASSSASVIQGNRIELTSENGGIGTTASPLKVNAGYTDTVSQRGFYGVKASAAGDIGIAEQTWSGNTGGNLLADTIVSTGGNVLVSAPGRIIDNNPIEQTDTRTWNELLNFWERTGVLENTQANVDKQNQAVASFEFGRTQGYRQYWEIRARQANPAVYDPAFQYTLTANERTTLGNQFLLQDPSLSTAQVTAKVNAFAAARTQQYHELNGQVGSLNGGTFSQSFQYVASTAERNQILNGASWTERELGISITPGLLKDITNTNPVVKSANVSGRTVTLNAGTALGETAAQINIPSNIDPATLTDAQKVALAAAERSDLVLTANNIGILPRKPVNFAAETALNATVTSATSALDDRGNAYLASLGDARIGSISAPGEVRVKVRGSIINADAANTSPVITSGNLILEAANGGIGYMPDGGNGSPLSRTFRVNSSSPLIARAADNIDITASGNLNVDTVFSRKDVKLTAGQSILDWAATDALDVLGNTMTLTAQNGTIGTLLNPLDIGVNPTGGISVAASQGIYINGPRQRSFVILSFDSGDAARLQSEVDMTLKGPVHAAGSIALIAGNRITMTGAANVNNTIDNITVDTAELVMNDGAQLTSAGRVGIQTTGNAIITGITANDSTANAVSITTGGGLYDGGDTRRDLVANKPGAKVTINATNGVGTGTWNGTTVNTATPNPIETDIVTVEATTTNGGFRVNELDALAITKLQTAGNVDMDTAGNLTVTDLTVTNGNAALRSTADITLTKGVVSGNALVRSTGGSIEVGTLSAAGITLQAPGTIHVSGNTLNASTSVNLAADNIDATIKQTPGSPGFLTGTITGFSGGPATNTNLALSSGTGFNFASLWTVNGTVNVSQGDFFVQNALVVDRLTVTNPLTNLVIEQRTKGPSGGDVQLFTGGGSFNFGMWGNHIQTDAQVIHRSPMIDVITPFGSNTSSEEQGRQELAKLPTTQPVPTFASDAPRPQLIQFSLDTVPVNLGTDEQCPPGATDCGR